MICRDDIKEEIVPLDESVQQLHGDCGRFGLMASTLFPCQVGKSSKGIPGFAGFHARRSETTSGPNIAQ